MVQPRPVPRVHCHRASPLARRKLPQSLSRGLLGTHGEPPPGALSAVVGRGAKGRRASPLPCTRPPLGTAEPGLGASRLQTRDGTFGREAAPFWAQRQGNAEFQPLCLGDRKPRPREVVQRTQGYTAANGLSEVQVQRSDAWFRDGSSETKAPALGGRRLPAGGWPAEVAALAAGSLSPVLSHSGPWLVWDKRKVAAQGAVTAPHGSQQPHGPCPAAYEPARRYCRAWGCPVPLVPLRVH